MELLKNLMTDTYSGDYTKIINVITTYLAENTTATIITQDIEKNKSNIIAIFGKPELLISCHMDTVPPVGRWTHNPTGLEESDGKLYGLGTADTKGNICCILKAAAQVRPKNLMLLFSTDEELEGNDPDSVVGSGYGSGVTRFLASEYARGLKHAIVCEPTSLKFIDQHKGYYSYKIEIRTEPSHSSLTSVSRIMPNSIAEAAEIITKLSSIGFNIGSIRGGTRENIVADSCEFTVSIRAYQQEKSVAEKIAMSIKPTSIATITLQTSGEPLIPQEKFPYTSAKMHKADFWTEASLFAKSGINSVVFGAGSIEQAHAPDEFVEKKQLDVAEKTLQDIMSGC